MKKLIADIAIIAACVALCAGVWPLCDAGEKVPSETIADAIAADVREKLMPVPEDTSDVPELASGIIAEKENQLEVNVPAITSETAPAHKSTKNGRPRFPLQQQPPITPTRTAPTSTRKMSTRKNASTTPTAISSARPLPSPPPSARIPSGSTATPTTMSPASDWWSGAARANAQRTIPCTNLV